jgi:hypothetical protein
MGADPLRAAAPRRQCRRPSRRGTCGNCLREAGDDTRKDGSRPFVIIGETMDRVNNWKRFIPFVETFQAPEGAWDPDCVTRPNRNWINAKIDQRKVIIDIGLDPNCANRADPEVPSIGWSSAQSTICSCSSRPKSNRAATWPSPRRLKPLRSRLASWHRRRGPSRDADRSTMIVTRTLDVAGRRRRAFRATGRRSSRTHGSGGRTGSRSTTFLSRDHGRSSTLTIAQ